MESRNFAYQFPHWNPLYSANITNSMEKEYQTLYGSGRNSNELAPTNLWILFRRSSVLKLRDGSLF